MTLGTPHDGLKYVSRLLDFFQWLPRIPLPRQFVWLQQLWDLGPRRSENLRALRDGWNASCILQQPGPPAEYKRYIRSVAVVGALDDWVSESSASGFAEVDAVEYACANHVALPKPISSSEATTNVIFRELAENHKPRQILGAVKQLRHDAVERNFLRQRNADRVATIVQSARPDLDRQAVQAKVESLLIDFLYDFPQRPLRGFSTIDAAFAVYAQRQLEPEL